MNKKEILKLTNDELNGEARDLVATTSLAKTMWPDDMYPDDMSAAWWLAESVYGRGGKIKSGAWALGTVENGRDCAHACLMWKSKSFTGYRPLQVSVTCPRGEMARAITLCWVCAMLGVCDE